MGVIGEPLVWLILTVIDIYTYIVIIGVILSWLVAFNVINQISFRTGSLDDLRAMKESLEDEGVQEFRQVSHGNAWSIYFADPEDNRIEIFVDSPWYIDQPAGEPIDLAESNEAIIAATKSHVQTQPGYGSLADWRSEMAKTLEDAAS